MNKSFLFVACFALAMAGCKSHQKAGSMGTVSSKDQQEGWQSLFDGKTTAGWHSYGKTVAGQSWKVNDGVLFFDTTRSAGGQSGDLVTNEEYDNFHLKLEWKIAKNGNSGIIFFVKEDPAKYPDTYNTGLEMQILDNDGHPDGKIHKHRSGDLYDLIASSKETVKPVGEWNLAEIVSDNGKLVLSLNGANVVSTMLWDENWKQLVAGSKFKTMSGFSAYNKGRIALQDHGNVVYFRNIRIKKL